jgi:mannose-6-phosphate isomerase-like protein (cupin superfamily)
MDEKKAIAAVGAAPGTPSSSFATPNFWPILTDAGNGQIFTMLGATMCLLATAAATGGRFNVFEQVTPVGWGSPRHIHSREDEIFYILEGTYELHVGDERRSVTVGASAVLPRHVPQGFRKRRAHTQPFGIGHRSRRIGGVFLCRGEKFRSSRSRTTG